MEAFKVGQKILERIAEENESHVPQKAQGCIVSNDDKGQHVFWLIHGQLERSHTVARNIVGDILEIQSTPMRFLAKTGEPCVSKNSPFGNALAELVSGVGELTFHVGNNVKHFDVLSNSLYLIKRNETDAHQGRILTNYEDGFEFETSLKLELDRIAKLKELLSTDDDITPEIRQKHIDEIQKLKEEIIEKRRNARKRRRTTASIREQFMLDPDQNKAKRSKLLNGPLIINGGPGTGKTTLLIHRIQYMLDPEIEKDELLEIKLNSEEKEFIRNQKTGWIFFSPTVLLKKYLENAMSAEGLEAHDETVKTWEQQRAALKTAMGLFNADTGRPFQAYRNDGPLWNMKVKQIVLLNQEFDKYALEFFKTKIEKFVSLNLKGLPWQKEGEQFKVMLAGVIKKFSLDGFIRTLNEAGNQFNALRTSIEKDYRDQMDNLASRIQQQLNVEDKDWFAALLRERRKKNDADIEGDETENEDLINSFEEEEVIDGKKLDVDINKLIKRVLRTDALSSIDNGTKLTAADKEILERIQPYSNKAKYSSIAAQSLFLKYVKPFLRGSDVYILTQLPRIYKSFRREILPNLEWLPISSKEKLKAIIEASPRNTRIHEDELDILLYISLKFARLFYTTSPVVFRESNNSILLSYSLYMKGLVAIDEATDFTPAQIGCMFLLSRPRLNSLTLSGDLMQQMNGNGIDSWEDLKELLPGLEIKSLAKSYRQTPKLLNLATALYKNRFNNEPGFYAAQKDDKDDPEALVFISPDFDAKVNWVAQRIAELYHIYEKIIPNIAIFVRNNDQIEKLTKALNDNEILIRNMIHVKGCVGEGEIGSAEFIRIFNINLIKGMEFETVFFMDVDEYGRDEMEMLDKLIYVGVSRATYYLAITLNDSFPERLAPVKHLLVENGTWSTELESDY